MGNFLLWSKHPLQCQMQHPMFIKDMKTTSESRMYYKTSSYHGLCTDLLKQSKVNVSKQVTERMWNLIHKYGTTICSNGWDNIAWRPWLNVILACLSDDLFISSIDKTGEQKDENYICNALARMSKQNKVYQNSRHFHFNPTPLI